MTDTLHDHEIKMIRVVEKIESMAKHCDRLADRIDKDMVTHDKLALVEVELKAIRKDLDKTSEGSTWLLRGLFGAMLSTAAGLAAYLLQKG